MHKLLSIPFILIPLLVSELPAQDFQFSDITEIKVSLVTDSSAVITWETEEPRDAQVEYGLDSNYGFESDLFPKLLISHQVKLAGLQPNTTYHFRAKSRNAFGQLALSADRVFTTLPKVQNPPPVISNIGIRNITSESASVFWHTDLPSNSILYLSTERRFDLPALVDETLVTEHELTITGLLQGTLYYVRAASVTAEGAEAHSQDLSFQTSLIGGATLNSPPVPVIEVPGKEIIDNRVTVSAGEEVRFIGSQSFDPDGDSLSFVWTFGDGAISEEADPVHIYAATGTYDLNLSVDDDRWPQYDFNPFVIPIQRPTTTERGGIIVADLDNDGLLDYVVTTKDDPLESETTLATIGVYAHDGSELWVLDVDLRMNKGFYGLPGKFGPGVGAADVDGDSETELVHLTTNDELVIRDGTTGTIEKTIALPPAPAGAEFWGQLQIVNLRGEGDKDVILQADVVPPADWRNKFPWLTAISLDTGEVLWETDQYDGLRHGGFRAADLDNDGLDEVAGAVMIDHDGTRMNAWEYRTIFHPGHFDAIAIEDVKPDIPGIEVILLEEAEMHDDNVAVFNADQIFFYATRNGDEPQNAAIGDFDPGRFGLEIWCRSRFNFDQQPWVIDASGNVVAEWIMNEKKPADWTTEGVEMIYGIDWDGGDKHYLAAKERHVDGDIAIIDAMTGDFIQVWEENAARIYVADVAGDYREEIIVVNSIASEIRIYWNEAENANQKPRYWRQNHYRRSKQNYNYYSAD